MLALPQTLFQERKLTGVIGLMTEDGASNNKAANKILKMPMKVCMPHDIARAVLIAAGLAGKPCQNQELKWFIERSSKQSAAFNRSGVANKDLQESQLEVRLEPHLPAVPPCLGPRASLTKSLPRIDAAMDRRRPTPPQATPL